MTVRFGGTISDFTITPTGAPDGSATFVVYTDPGLTVAAALQTVGGVAIGNTVTSRPSGVFEFDAPAGTTVLYVADSDGSSVALSPRPDLAYATAAGLSETVTALIAQNPQLLADVAALLASNANIATSTTLAYTKNPNDEGFIGDAAGHLSKVGFDKQGEIAEATMLSAQGKGMPRVVGTGSGGFGLVDANGNRYALGFDGTGQFDNVAKNALINLLHAYTGPDQPYVFPGNFVDWTQTDNVGNVLGTYRGNAT